MNQPKQEEGSALYEAQRRRTVAQAIREETENRVRNGELVEREAVEKDWNAIGRQTRDKFENLASRLAGLVAAERSQEKCFQIIAKEVRQCLESLAGEHV